MQLVAYGAQDIYLTGNPQITFFKVVYRRHTNFAMECVQQTINGASAINGGKGTVTVSRNGDLLSKVYVTSATAGFTSGDAIISDVTLEIGGQQIDKHTQEWLQIYAELNTPESKAVGYKSLTGCLGISGVAGTVTGNVNVMVPLQFYFCRNPGLALPLIALQYHEVKLVINWGLATAHGAAATATAQVWADYIYLDTDERRRFAQVSHEYLIEQLQYSSTTGSASMKLNFNHPVKELVWTDSNNVAYTNAKLVLNGHDRFAAQQPEYFQLRQPLDHHTAVPKQNLPASAHTFREGTIVRNVSVGAASQNIDSGPMRVPANSVVTELAVIVTTALAFANGTLGVSFGTAAGTTQFTGNLDVDSLIGANTSIAAGIGNSTSTFINAALNGQAALTFQQGTGDILTDTDIHGRVRASAVPGFTANTGAVTFIVKYVSFDNNVECRTSTMTNKINCYSFALKPEEHQPSGTCNFSRIDSAFLKFGTNPTGTVNLYAVNYNVLRVMSGMGGLAYSN